MDTNRDIKRIGVDELETGMYREDVFNAKDVLMVSARTLISSAGQVAALKRQVVETVEINLEKSDDAPREHYLKNAPDERAEKTFDEELPKAREVYSRTLLTARNALTAIRRGRPFPEKELEKVVEEIVDSLLRNPDALLSLSQIKVYDESTYGHSVNVAILACSLARAMACERDALVQAGIGGLLHDIGKTRIPDYIVNKPTRFSDAEFAIMRKHVEYGLEIVKPRKGIPELSKKMIVQHHERFNGNGYPSGLRGNEMHVMGAIAGIADVYDAMTSKRVYRDAFTPQQALAAISGGSDIEFPRAVTELFIRLLGVYPVGSFVRLESGKMGIVVRVDREDILSPDVVVLFSADGRLVDEPEKIKVPRRNGGMTKKNDSSRHRSIRAASWSM